MVSVEGVSVEGLSVEGLSVEGLSVEGLSVEEARKTGVGSVWGVGVMSSLHFS
jgi:hypothetical protein